MTLLVIVSTHSTSLTRWVPRSKFTS